MTTLKDRKMRGELIEMYKVMSSRESIDCVKPLNLRKNVGRTGPAVSFIKHIVIPLKQTKL